MIYQSTLHELNVTCSGAPHVVVGMSAIGEDNEEWIEVLHTFNVLAQATQWRLLNVPMVCKRFWRVTAKVLEKMDR